MKKLIFSFIASTVFLLFLHSPVNAQQPLFKVLRVIDGDTIVVDVRGQKEVVRLLGIDTPEAVDSRKPVQCFAKEASNKMKSFVQGKSVILVDDSTQGNRDKYRRLLRYIYLPDSVRTFVNGEIVKQGYAFSYREYPTKMLEKFNGFEKYARENSLGLWGSCPVTSTKSTVGGKSNVVKPTTTKNLKSTSDSFTCDCSKICVAMSSCAEAQFQLNNCGCSARDADRDGIACDSQCQ